MKKKGIKKTSTKALPDRNISPHTKISIDEILRRADELGMTYGKYTSSQQYITDICEGIFMSGKYKKMKTLHVKSEN